jgi:nucleoside-diphosphate-sugar epimerase
MQVFLTGATGFIGSQLVPELINAGHHVIGLCRAAAGADALTRAGAEVLRGDVNDFDRLRAGAGKSDAVIHTAFNHDFSNLRQNSENDRKVIETLGEELAGSERPLLITSGRASPGQRPADWPQKLTLTSRQPNFLAQLPRKLLTFSSPGACASW